MLDWILFLSVFFSHPVLKGCCFSSLLFDILFKKSEALYNFFGSINDLIGQTFDATEIIS